MTTSAMGPLGSSSGLRAGAAGPELKGPPGIGGTFGANTGAGAGAPVAAAGVPVAAGAPAVEDGATEAAAGIAGANGAPSASATPAHAHITAAAHRPADRHSTRSTNKPPHPGDRYRDTIMAPKAGAVCS